MLRLPPFRFLSPTTLEQACALKAEHGADAVWFAGGTDLLPNMKRGQHSPAVLISLAGIAELQEVRLGPAPVVGAGLTLARVAGLAWPAAFRALPMAAATVATPQIRNSGTLGGNLCLDTRCNYYNQNRDWREAIDWCMKAPSGTAVRAPEGGICWVAPGSKRCLAVSSSDTAPALMALGAEVELVSVAGRRRIPLGSLYRNDGMDFLTLGPDELLARVVLPALGSSWRSTCWKLRRRGSFDFPVLSVGAAVSLEGDRVEQARLVLGAVDSAPIEIDCSALVGGRLTDEAVAGVAEVASKRSRPFDNTDYGLKWRKMMARRYVVGALRQLRGDPVEELGMVARRAARLPLF